MILEITNETDGTLNALQSGGNQVSPDAVGGNIINPLPYPFNANGSLPSGESLSLAIHPRDLVLRQQLQQPEVPADVWDAFVQQGLISLAWTNDTNDVVDIEEQLINEI